MSVDVDISDIAIIKALNTPGGEVFEWRDKVAHLTIELATAASPVNDVLNARHRAGWVGEYKASWGFDRMGSNGHIVRATVYNGSDHADIVENGRRRSTGYERFSWTKHSPPGAVSAHKRGTSGRLGKHILEKAAHAAVAAST